MSSGYASSNSPAFSTVNNSVRSSWCNSPVAQILGDQSRKQLRLEEVDLTAFKRFPDIPQEVRNGQVRPYNTPHRDPCFTRQQGAELRVGIYEFLARRARRPAAFGLQRWSQVESKDRVEQ